MNGRISPEEREEIRVRELAALEAARRDSINLAAAAAAQMAEAQGAGDSFDPLAQEAAEEAARQQETLLAQQQARTPTVQQSGRRNNLTPDNPAYANLARALLREGRVRAAMSQPWDAILAYEQVIAEYPRTEFAAEAQYRIAYTHEVYLEDYDEAERNYDLVASQGLSSFGEDATRRSGNLDTMRRMSAALQDSSAAATGAAAEARFLRAELYLYQQSKPRRALQEYRSIRTDFAGTDYAAKALLAESWIYEHEFDDADSADVVLNTLLDQFPDTEYGAYASRRIQGPAPDPDPTLFAGPALDDLLTPENIASVTAYRQEHDPNAGVPEALAQAGGSPGSPGSTVDGSGTPDAAATMAAITAGTTLPGATGGGAGLSFDTAGLDPFAVPSDGNTPILNAWQREPDEVHDRTGTMAAAPGFAPPPIQVASTAPDTLAAPTPPAATPAASDTTKITPPPRPAPRLAPKPPEVKEEPKEQPKEESSGGR